MARVAKATTEVGATKVGEFSVNGMRTFKVRCTFIDDILGACPCDDDVYRTYIADKWEKASENATPRKEINKKISEEAEALPEVEEELEDMKITVFLRDKDGDPCFSQHVIKGFFKNAAKAFYYMGGEHKLSGYKSKIDNCIFVNPDYIKIHTEDPITVCERPLRAETAQGPRVALAASEAIKAGAWIEFEIRTMSKEVEPFIVDWLSYGQLNGLGQWHNGGKGRFTWQDISVE